MKGFRQIKLTGSWVVIDCRKRDCNQLTLKAGKCRPYEGTKPSQTGLGTVIQNANGQKREWELNGSVYSLQLVQLLQHVLQHNTLNVARHRCHGSIYQTTHWEKLIYSKFLSSKYKFQIFFTNKYDKFT